MQLRKTRFWYQFRELFRDLVIFSARLDPFCHAMFRRALLVFATTPDSAQCVPQRYRHKVRCHLSIGIDERNLSSAKLLGDTVRLLYIGNFLPWKGPALAIAGFAEFVRSGGKARLTLVGQGPEETMLRELAKQHEIDHLVDWVPWVDHGEIHKVYRAHDIFLFPSLHDSGGQVVIEAMAQGMPVVCLDLGGPPQSVGTLGGIVVATTRLSTQSVAEGVAGALKRIVNDPTEYARLSRGALARARDFFWSARVSTAVALVHAALGGVRQVGKVREVPRAADTGGGQARIDQP